jgi:hypothetical protein
MQALPIPGLTPGYLAAKRGAEKLIDRVAPLKVAFQTSQYSTPLNPDIRSGASDLPPFRAPQLRVAIQKNGGAVTPKIGPAYGDLTKAGSVDDFLFKIAAVPLGQWWDQVGGPHLAKGGSHAEFKKMMDTEGIPPNVQKKFMDVAKEKYPPGYSGLSAHTDGGKTPFDTKMNDAYKRRFGVPMGANLVGGAAALGLGARMFAAPAEDDPNAAPEKWKGRIGAYLQNAPLPWAGHGIGKVLGGTKGGLIGGLGGAGLGALAAETELHQLEKERQSSGRRAARTETASNNVLEEAKPSSAALGKKILLGYAPTYALSSYFTGGRSLGLDAGVLAALATGRGMTQRYGNLVARQSMEQAQKEGVKPKPKAKEQPVLQKSAASAPTRGNFMMASDLPPFQSPRLDRAIQKNGGPAAIPASGSVNDNPMPENTSKYAGSKEKRFLKLEGDALIEVDKDGKSLGKGPVNRDYYKKEKDSDSLGLYYPYSSGDFKRSKYAMSTGQLSEFVAELLKEGAFNTPASQLAKTQSIGAPKATPPPGPSIAQIAKPRGARFGVGIPGAFKSRIGGDAGVSLT